MQNCRCQPPDGQNQQLLVHELSLLWPSSYRMVMPEKVRKALALLAFSKLCKTELSKRAFLHRQ